MVVVNLYLVVKHSLISTIIHWKYDKISECFTTKYKLTTTIGGKSYLYQKIKCLQVLLWWATDLTLRGKYIFLAYFDATMMVYCIYEEKLDYYDWKKDPDIEKLDKLSHRKWVAYNEMVYTYFNTMKNI